MKVLISVLPLCLGGCPLLSGEMACVPEKYVLEDMLVDYVRHPEEWDQEDEL